MDQCPVCSQTLKPSTSGVDRRSRLTCPTYHYLLYRDDYIVTHTIFLDGNVISWHNPRDMDKYCELRWNEKTIKINWLDIQFPVDLDALRVRIKKLLLFL